MWEQAGHRGVSLDAEVRHVTYLQCDIVDSTGHALRLGDNPERQRELVRAYQRVISDVASRHHGRRSPFVGDGALISFGLYPPREDAAEAAIRTGLDLVEAIRALRPLPGVFLDIRVGIASGRVAVERDPGDYDREPAVGLTINLAARLCQAAAPGTVVIDDQTQRLAGGFFQYEDLHGVEAKGFDTNVHAWEVKCETGLASRFEAQRVSASSARIVGRSAELAALHNAWESVMAGRGRNVLLVGDAGIGKSRLARAALEQAAADDALILQVDCAPSTSNSPLFPVGALLRRAAQIGTRATEDQTVARAQKLLHDLLPSDEAEEALGYLAPLFGLSSMPIPAKYTPLEVRERTIATVVKIVDILCTKQPAVMLCEDLHWADATTLEVLRRIAQRTAGWRTLLLATSRDLANDGGLPLDLFSVIQLAPLDERASAELVHAVAPGISTAELEGIVERCGGVPLFLEELTRSTLERKEGVPATLHVVVESRLGRLKELASIAQTASVLGREFSLQTLQQMMPERASEVEPALAAFVQEGLFAPSSKRVPDRARFKHALIRDAVYETMFESDRRRLHSLAADVLQAAFESNPDASAEDLAHHLCEAQRFLDAVEVHRTAARDTARRGAHIESMHHCEAGLSIIDSLIAGADPQSSTDTRLKRLRLALLVQSGVAATGIYGYAAVEVERIYGRTQSLFDADTTPEERYPVIRGLAALHLVRGNLATAYELSAQGSALAELSQRPDYRIDAMTLRSYTTLYFGRLADCREWLEKSLALYEQEAGATLIYPVPHDPAATAWGLLSTVAWLLGDVQGAEDAIRRGTEHVERLGRDFDKALLHCWIAGTRYTQRRYAEALQHAQIALGVSQERGFAEWHGIAGLLACLAQAALQPAPMAVAQALQICETFRQAGVGLNASYYLWGLARGIATAGDEAKAQEMLAAAAACATASQETRMDAELLLLRAELEKKPAQAAHLQQRAFACASEQGAVATALRAALALVQHRCTDAADLERARLALDVLDGRDVAGTRKPSWMQTELHWACTVGGLPRAGATPT